MGEQHKPSSTRVLLCMLLAGCNPTVQPSSALYDSDCMLAGNIGHDNRV
jgi:hypothetical protein